MRREARVTAGGPLVLPQLLLLLPLARLTAPVAVAVVGLVHEMVMVLGRQGIPVPLSKSFFSGKGKRGVGKIPQGWGEKAFVMAQEGINAGYGAPGSMNGYSTTYHESFFGALVFCVGRLGLS